MNGYDIELKDTIEHNPDFKNSPILQKVHAVLGVSEVQNSRLLLDALLEVESNRLALLDNYIKVLNTGKHPKTVLIDSMMRLGDSKKHKSIEQENKKFGLVLDTMDRLGEFYANVDLAKCCFPFGYDEYNNNCKHEEVVIPKGNYIVVNIPYETPLVALGEVINLIKNTTSIIEIPQTDKGFVHLVVESQTKAYATAVDINELPKSKILIQYQDLIKNKDNQMYYQLPSTF